MSNIISFSLWGSESFYFNGCIENIELAKEIYPGWTVRFYCDSKVDKSFLDKLESKGAQVIVMDTITNNWEGLFWRFMPASETNVDVFISRDIDSRLNYREKAAVDEWLVSDKKLHCMRDHLEHNVPILGGMWGCKKGLIPDIGAEVASWGKYDYKGCDQDFLRERIWESFRSEAIVHDRYCIGLVIHLGRYIEQYYVQPEMIDGKIAPKEQYAPEEYIDNQLVIPEYSYQPKLLFGDHDLRPFPKHLPITHGTHVGEIIR